MSMVSVVGKENEVYHENKGELTLLIGNCPNTSDFGWIMLNMDLL